MNDKKQALIIGAGPAGLTAAYELLNKSDIHPVVCEESDEIGGISKTVEYKGNRIDIGGHRFFSKSDAVMQWWQNVMPIQGKPSVDDILLDNDKPFAAGGPIPKRRTAQCSSASEYHGYSICAAFSITPYPSNSKPSRIWGCGGQ